MPPEAMPWVVGLLVMGALSTFGFLARNAFGKVESGIERLDTKLDSLKESMGKSDTRVALLERDVATLQREVAELRREMAEGVVR